MKRIETNSCSPEIFRVRSKQGFTLIELLVVVLIIAILAAVAMPQYNKTIRKARGTEALNTLAALDKALAMYYLENGSYEGIDGGELLNIEMPELKHFRFGVGSNVYEKGSTNLSILIGSQHALQIGSANPQVVYTQMISPENMALNLKWEQGKLIEQYCEEMDRYSPISCEDYFNCTRTSARERKVQTGYPDYYEGPKCYLN